MDKKEHENGLTPFQDPAMAVEPYLICTPAGRVLYASGPLKNMVDEDLTGRNLNDFLEDAVTARLISDCLEGRSREFRCEIRGQRFSARAEPWEDAEGILVLLFPVNAVPGDNRWFDPEQNLFLAREINQELAIMLPAADSLEENATQLQREKLAVLRQRIYRMIRLSRNLQDSALVQIGEMRANYSQEDMTGLCRELLDRVEPICAEQGIVLRRELPDHPIPCRVDPALLRRMLCNLLSNAVKAQPAGGSIDVLLKEGGPDMVMITVIDRGCGPENGIPESLFRRRERKELLTSPGMSLGLALTRAFAELQGGRLMLMYSGDNGLVAKLILPVNRDKGVDVLRSGEVQYGVGIDPVLVEMSTVANRKLYRKDKPE